MAGVVSQQSYVDLFRKLGAPRKPWKGLPVGDGAAPFRERWPLRAQLC